jgi:hypothetical protein
MGPQPRSPNVEPDMEFEYTLVDCSTGLIYGPFETFNQARERAENFERWEIINREGNLINWSPTPSTVLTATEQAA